MVLLGALGAFGDVITMFDETTPYPVAEVGLALCTTTQACASSPLNAIAVFHFSPPSGGGEITIDASDPAFGPIAGYLSMTEDEIVQNALYEEIVPFYWNAGPKLGADNFYTATNPNVNFYMGHFDQSRAVIDGETYAFGYPIAGNEIDALTISVSSQGELKWQAKGVNIVIAPEPSSLLSLLAELAVIFALLVWLRPKLWA
jgi:hypothetical protein